MLEFLTTLSMRSLLKEAYKTQSIIIVSLSNVSIPVQVLKVGFMSFVADVYDIDEETWLGREVIPISYVTSVNLWSVERQRIRLMVENGEDISELYESYGGHSCAESCEEEDKED